MAKLLSATLILVSVGGVIARGQQLTEPLSVGDKSKLIESVLDLELRTQASVPDFANIRQVSSDNIEFIEPSQISKLGFTIVGGSYLRESKKDRVVEYLLFKKISLRNGVAAVVLSRVTEGRPCFGAAFSQERSYTYESRRTAGGWVSQLTRRPPPLISFAPKRSATR
jgi:hypothetical protein